jgi:excisionase family DNA binding protein
VTEFLSPAQLAEFLGISRDTIYNWRYLRQGPPAVRVGGQVRFRRSDVERWLQENEEEPRRQAVSRG